MGILNFLNRYLHVKFTIRSITIYMYFLWAKINMASYGHTMFSLKLLILIGIRQCSMACFRTKCWWEVGGVGSAFPPGTILLGLSRTILTCLYYGQLLTRPVYCPAKRKGLNSMKSQTEIFTKM